MKRLLFIFLIWFAILPLGAEVVVATVKHYNEASLSGDLSGQMKVTFTNSSNNKGKVGEKDMAVLTLSGIPPCTIDSISLVMSQSNNAAASLSLALGDSSWVIANESSFHDWPGVDEDAVGDQRIICLSQPVATPTTSLKITIKGYSGSVYLKAMQVVYTPVPKRPHTVTLNWFGSDYQWHQSSMTEDSIESGIQLPALPSADSAFVYQDQSWHWIGWSEQLHPLSNESPTHYWEKDDWYVPEEDMPLYALFTNAITYTLLPDSSPQNGEYALAYFDGSQTIALAGDWQDGYIAMLPLPRQTDYICDDLRYQLTFYGDSLTIRHPYTQSWIGYNGKSGSNKQTKWLWKPAAKGSLFIYNGTLKHNDKLNYDSGWSLGINRKNDQGDLLGSFDDTIYDTQTIYWRLYPTGHLPSSANADYTTFTATSSLNSTSTHSAFSRQLIRYNGQIIILHNNHKYNLLGLTL